MIQVHLSIPRWYDTLMIKNQIGLALYVEQSDYILHQRSSSLSTIARL